MLDFLFRFSVLNTAFTVIGKEIGEKLGSLGGRWFRCLYIWTLFFYISEWRNNTFPSQVITIGLTCFLAGIGYVMIVTRLRSVKYLNLLDIGCLRRFATLLGKMTFPLALWRYVWRPINSVLWYIWSSFVPVRWAVCCTFIFKGLALILILVVANLCCQNPCSPPVSGNTRVKKQDRVSVSVPQRPPSARIQAMRLRQEKQQQTMS